MNKINKNMLRKVAKAKAHIAGGMPVKLAIKRAKISVNTFYRYAQKATGTPAGEKTAKTAKRARTAVIAHDVPEVQASGKLFLILGSAADLADFARSYS